MSEKLRIGEVAELFDVTTKTLRHYEKLGLLKPEREENGYRLYGPEDVQRVQRIRQLQSLGLPLKEVSRLLAQDDERLWESVLRSLREEAAAEMALLQERVEWIEQLLDEGLPPDQEMLPAPPGKVNEYLEQHLPESSRVAWQRDTQVYASLSAALGVPGSGDAHVVQAVRRTAWDRGQFLPGQPFMLPAGLRRGFASTANGNGNEHHPPMLNGDGERAILRALQKYGRVIDALEDDKR